MYCVILLKVRQQLRLWRVTLREKTQVENRNCLERNMSPLSSPLLSVEAVKKQIRGYLWYKHQNFSWLSVMISLSRSFFSVPIVFLPQMFGFDVLIDRELKPHLMEVNFAPSLNTDSTLDFQVKSKVKQGWGTHHKRVVSRATPPRSDCSKAISSWYLTFVCYHVCRYVAPEWAVHKV